uniref:Uncharacterized protein n=1 Tax=Aegilops tauschii subsp. strangulata TaxID=200361 RepID=A0A453EL30_AEGTS
MRTICCNRLSLLQLPSSSGQLLELTFIDVSLHCVTVHIVHFMDEERCHVASSALYLIINFEYSMHDKENQVLVMVTNKSD